MTRNMHVVLLSKILLFFIVKCYYRPAHSFPVIREAVASGMWVLPQRKT